MLIHVGIDTVKLNGEHFDLKVSSGQHVTAGELLVEFDLAAIEAAGYDTITPVLVLNGDLCPQVVPAASGPVAHGEPLFVAIAVESSVTA